MRRTLATLAAIAAAALIAWAGTTTFEGTVAADDVTIADDLTVTDDASVGGDLTITGSSSVGDSLYVGGNIGFAGSLFPGGKSDIDITGALDVSGQISAAVVETDTIHCESAGDKLYLRGTDGKDDLTVYASAFNGAITGAVTGDVNCTIAEVDTLKPGSGTAFYLRANDGQDDADLNIYDVSATNDVSAATFTGALTGDVDAAIVEADTLKPGTGAAFYLRANDGQDDADLNVYDVSATNDVSAASFTGQLVGDVNAAIVEADTLKPGTGTAFYLRAIDGQDDADLNVYDVSATNEVDGALGDFTTVEADTFKAGSGADVYVRANDGQNDAVLNAYRFTGSVLQDTTGIRYQGNLPAAADHFGEFYINASGLDSVWVSNGTGWVQVAP